ncbi:MAG: efflux RND transporter periplasmic adaptor subunit [Candidatus Aminicenantes bacterium]|nr:efflux RND transporter periplasmic adaptor subunit [Candidatus Aminicenantes bacterium]
MGMDRKIKKKKWPPKKIATFAAAGLFVIVVIYMLIFGVSKSTLNVKAERLTISTVTRGPFQEFIPIMGNVLPIYQFYLSAEEGGTVEEIYIEAGNVVEKGDKILKLANTDLLINSMWREAELFQQVNNLRNTRLDMERYRLQLSQELANIDNDLQQQKRTFERYQKLFDDDLISEHEYELAKDQFEYLKKRRKLTVESQQKDLEFRESQVEALEEQVNRMQGNLNVIQGRLEKLTIRAPVSGHLTALEAEIGQSKSAGQNIGQIDVLDGFRVRAGIDEHYLARVEVGRSGEFEFAGEKYQLEVTKKYPEVTEGRFEVDMEFVGEEPEGITRGQTLHIRLELGDISEALLVPKGGFYQTTGGNWVYVVNESGDTALKRRIRLGRQNPDVYEVLDGLQPGEKVITSSYESFGDMERLVLK